MIRVCFLSPAAALESIPIGVIFMLSARIASGIPLTSLSTTARVASGVTSLIEKPVPPVVATRVTFSSSAHLTSSALICSISSGIIVLYSIFQPFSSRILTTASPAVSSLSPWEPLSLIVITAALYSISFPLFSFSHTPSSVAADSRKPATTAYF